MGPIEPERDAALRASRLGPPSSLCCRVDLTQQCSCGTEYSDKPPRNAADIEATGKSQKKRSLRFLRRCVHHKRMRHFEHLACALVVNLNPFDADQVGLQCHQSTTELLALPKHRTFNPSYAHDLNPAHRLLSNRISLHCVGARPTHPVERLHTQSRPNESAYVAWLQHADMHDRIERDERRARSRRRRGDDR